MRKFPILFITVNAIISTVLWLVNKALIILYLCLPLGLFMLLMQLRSKNNKATAIGAFTNVESEFQFIFPDYILVANKPNNLRTNYRKSTERFSAFVDKWGLSIITVVVSALFILSLIRAFSLCL